MSLSRTTLPTLLTLLTLLSLLLCPVAASGDDEGARARELFRRAEVHFSTGEFQPALELYTAAYKLRPLPGFLFNIGQCQRRLQRCDRAVFFFRRYLHELPGAPNRAVVEDLVRECEQILGRQRAAARPAPLAAGDEPRRARRQVRPLWFWSSASVAAALLITGAVTGGLTLAKSSEYHRDGTSVARRQELQDAGEPLGNVSTATIAAGATVAIGAGILYLFTDWGGAGEARGALLPVRGGAAVALEGRF